MFLSKVEKAYLSGTKEFTKPQIRYIKCRLNKKLRHLNEELISFGIIPNDILLTTAVAATKSCNSVAANCNASSTKLQLGKAELRTTAKACKLM